MIDTSTRHAHLRDILLGRRRELREEVERRIRDGRTDRALDVCDELELSDADISREVAVALLQMKAETLQLIENALRRLEVGDYGNCLHCAAQISETRLRALPFAVRCRECEEHRERVQAQNRQAAQVAGFSRYLQTA